MQTSNEEVKMKMHETDFFVSDAQVEDLKKRGYNEDVVPKTAAKRNMSMKNYFTLWMGSVHNIPNYTAVGGFLFLGAVANQCYVSSYHQFSGSQRLYGLQR